MKKGGRGMEGSQNLFEPFVGRLVQCIFRDGKEIAAKKGRLVQAREDFIVLQTFSHTYVIRTSEILKLKDVREER